MNFNVLTEIQKWINQVFNITNVQSAPIIITLSVFILGFLFSAIGRLLKNISERKAIRNQLYPLLKSLKEDIAVQAEKCRDSSTGLNLNDASTFNVHRVDFYQVPILIDFKYTKIFESLFFGIENYFGKRRFNRAKKKELFAKSWRAVHGIPFWQERTIKDMEFVMGQYKQYNEKRNTEMIEFEKLNYVFYTSTIHPQAYASKELYKQIDSIRIAWNLLPNSIAPEVIHNNLVEPVLKLCENNPLEYAQMIRFCLTSASLQFENMNRLINNYKIQFNTYADHFETFSTDLDIALKEIRKF